MVSDDTWTDERADRRDVSGTSQVARAAGYAEHQTCEAHTEVDVTRLSGMVIGTKARVLVALALGVAGLGLSTGQAQARRNDNGVRCAMDYGNGHVDFSMPGYSYRVGSIRTTCDSAGEWVSTYVGPRGRGC